MKMKKLQKSLLAASILVLLMGTCFGVAWSAHPETIITNLTASIGGGAYTLSSAMTDIARKYHPWLRISTAETPGYIYNLRAHDKDPKKWKNTIVSSNHAVIYLAEQGKAPFKKKITGYKFLGNYNTLTRWLVTLNPNIKGPKDLIGKKIALGFKTQIDWAVTPDYLLQYGWKIKDKLNIVYMGSNPAIGALIDGTVDVAQIDAYMNPFTGEVVGGKPTVDLIASGKKVYHIPWGKDSIEKTKKETGYPVSSITIRAGAFKGWLKEDIVTWVYTNCFAAKDVFPADLAYELIRLCLQNVGKFKEYHAMGKLLSPEALCYGFTQKDLHPGALKAYKEAGLKIPEK
jgi:TRAP transporter TAXI family solute receptor